jgi:hypothetical protein
MSLSTCSGDNPLKQNIPKTLSAYSPYQSTYLRGDVGPRQLSYQLWLFSDLRSISNHSQDVHVVCFLLVSHVDNGLVLMVIIRSAIPLTSPLQIFISPSSSKISATILAP